MAWNAKYDWPRFVISGTSEAFRALEERHGDELPVVRGDWTPYWEDGAGSSAHETAMNRNSADRLSQAEALFAMRMPQDYPAADFQEAWNHVMLYSEHTWGADVSVSEPESEKTQEQWQIKQSYARQAERQSRELLERALEAGGPAVAGSWDVINTLAWPRSEIVVLDAVQSTAGDRVVDESGAPVPSQRLKTGGLAFLASEVPPFGCRRFTVTAGEAHVEQRATADGLLLDSGIVRVQVDGKTGGIQSLSFGFPFDVPGGEMKLDLPLARCGPRRIKSPARARTGFPSAAGRMFPIVTMASPGSRSMRRWSRSAS
jgi:alpha-mannosidase